MFNTAQDLYVKLTSIKNTWSWHSALTVLKQ